MDVRQHISTGNGSLNQGVELFVSTNRQLQMTRGDSLHLEILGSISSQLQNLSSEVFQNGGSVHGSSGSDTSIGSRAALEHPMDTSHGELEASLARAGNGGLSLRLKGRER